MADAQVSQVTLEVGIVSDEVASARVSQVTLEVGILDDALASEPADVGTFPLLSPALLARFRR